MKEYERPNLTYEDDIQEDIILREIKDLALDFITDQIDIGEVDEEVLMVSYEFLQNNRI